MVPVSIPSRTAKPFVATGKNRQIREMFEAIGHPVVKLRRIRIGFLTDHGLGVGKFRHLTMPEVDRILRAGKAKNRRIPKSLN